MQFEERAQRELDDLARAFAATGDTVETRLAFTSDASRTIERVALDERCRAVLLVNPAPVIDHALVALRNDSNIEQVIDCAATLLADRDVAVTVFYVATDEADREGGTKLVAAAADLLEARGVPADLIATEVVVSDTPIRTLLARADDDYDLVIIGETPQRIVERALEPVLVVRRLETDER